MIIDLHCHPALKLFLFEDSVFSKKLQEEQKSKPGINFTYMLLLTEQGDGGGIVFYRYVIPNGMRTTRSRLQVIYVLNLNAYISRQGKP